jgi:hypothetical protein
MMNIRNLKHRCDDNVLEYTSQWVWVRSIFNWIITGDFELQLRNLTPSDKLNTPIDDQMMAFGAGLLSYFAFLGLMKALKMASFGLPISFLKNQLLY